MPQHHAFRFAKVEIKKMNTRKKMYLCIFDLFSYENRSYHLRPFLSANSIIVFLLPHMPLSAHDYCWAPTQKNIDFWAVTVPPSLSAKRNLDGLMWSNFVAMTKPEGFSYWAAASKSQNVRMKNYYCGLFDQWIISIWDTPILSIVPNL